MDIENVRLSWDEILAGYIDFYEGIQPDLHVRSQMEPIIDQLNNNRIKSRAVMVSGKVACYAFFIAPATMTDRYYGMAGFVSRDYFDRDKLKNLLDWMYGEAKKDHRMLMLNEVFNDEEFDRHLTEYGFSRIERFPMVLQLDQIQSQEIEHREGSVSAVSINPGELQQIIDMHDVSYSGSADTILESTVEIERKKFWINMFEGRAMGRYLTDSSFWVLDNGIKAGAVITTETDSGPLIADIFIVPQMRRKGLGSYLLMQSLMKLKQKGYSTVSLWVTSGNTAEKVYRKLGFSEIPGKYERIYFKRA